MLGPASNNSSQVFEIDLESSASNRAFDGRLRGGALAGATVNIKWYATRQNLLDLRADATPDYYLVFLIETLRLRGRKIGIATSVPQAFWQQAEVFSTQTSETLVLDPGQRERLGLFDLGRQSV